MKKIEVKLLFIIFLIIVCLSGILLGARMEQERAAAEKTLDTTNEIAVVNLDEGIREENRQVYYSNDLSEYPDESFISTNLDCRERYIFSQ